MALLAARSRRPASLGARAANPASSSKQPERSRPSRPPARRPSSSGPSPVPTCSPSTSRGTREGPVVRWPDGRERDVLDALTPLCELLLQRGLLVDRLGEGLLDPRLERLHHRARELLEATLEVERRQHRLHERREDVRRTAEIVRDLAALLQAAVEAQTGRDDRARTPRDDVGANLRQLTLGEVGVAVVERARDHEAEDAVAEKLEPLVRLDPILGLGRMAEDLLEPSGRQRVDQPLERGCLATDASRRSRRPARRW